MTLKVTRGSDNVFVDLGFPMFARADMRVSIEVHPARRAT